MAINKTTKTQARSFYLLDRLLRDWTAGTRADNMSKAELNATLRNVISHNMRDENKAPLNVSLLRNIKTALTNDGLYNGNYEADFSGTPEENLSSLTKRLQTYLSDYADLVYNGKGSEVLTYVSPLDTRKNISKYLRIMEKNTGQYDGLIFGKNVDVDKLNDDPLYPKVVIDPNYAITRQDRMNDYTDGKYVLVSPYMNSPYDAALAKNSDTNSREYRDARRNEFKKRGEDTTSNALMNDIEVAFGDTPINTDPDNEGHVEPLKGFEQINKVLGQYVSDTDLKAIRNAVSPEHQYSAYGMKRAKDVLTKLYDSGADFTLKPRIDEASGDLDIRADIASSNSNPLQVSVLKEPGDEQYIGRVYDGHGAYYVNMPDMVGKSSFVLYTDSDLATAPLDFITQKGQSRINLNMNDTPGSYGFKADGENALIQSIEMYHPMSDPSNRYADTLQMRYRDYEKRSDLDAVHPDTEEDARARLRRLIDSSRVQFITKLVGPDLTNVDNVLADYQGQLRDYIKENDLDESMLDNLSDLQIGMKANVSSDFIRRHELTDADVENYRKVTDKINELTDDGVGTFNDGFHPANVINLTSEVANNHTQEQLVASLMKSDYDTSKLKQDDTTKRFMEAMIKYRGTSKQVTTLDDTDDNKNPNESTEINPFKRNMMQFTADTLADAGIVGDKYDISSNSMKPTAGTAPKVTMDDQGIIHWEGYRVFGKRGTRSRSGETHYRKISGEIGQIFAPDEHGIAHIALNGNEKYDYVPGINGYFQYSGLEDSNDPNRMKRIRGEGYEQLMRREIYNTLHVQALRPYRGVSDLTYASDVTALNKIYHGESYGTRLEAGWFDNPETDKAVGKETKAAIIDNLQRRIHFPNKLRDNATTFSEDPDSQNGVSALVDNKNMRVLDRDYLGYFDMTMTGTNKTQGMVLYMSEGTRLNTDGTFSPVMERGRDAIKADPTIINAPVRRLPYFKYQKFNAWDRNQMASNQILTANGVDQSRTALMTMGGWTYDDSAVISKEFAERNMVKGEDGEYRPLMKGDKLSDFGGNKATIGLVVDRDMDPEQAKAEGIEKEVAIFNQNPDLDTVMSPYSVITRDNTGVVHELMDNDPQPIMFTDPETGETSRVGDSGKLNLIVTDMLADSKTHAYSEEDIADGKGRKLSSQYVWALNQHGANKIVQTAFNKNERQWMAYREYLMTVGYDISEDGNIVAGYRPHADELRKVYEPSADVESEEFIRQLGSAGGMMQLPFEYTTASGSKTDQLPIMSASLRYNTEFMDGSTKVNDYTKNYAAIYDSVVKYQSVKNRLNELKSYESHPEDFQVTGKQTLDQKIKSAENSVKRWESMTKRQIDSLSDNIINDKLGGKNGEYSKHSFMRDHLMGIRMDHSATAIATADPRLSVNDVSISQDVAKSLDVQDGDYALVNRDPCLHAGSIRAMKVHIDDSIQGIAISPTADKSFDGDFDGDTYGLITMPEFKTDPEIKKELEKMEVKNNLLDPGAPEPTSYLNVSMDVVSGSIPAGTTDYVDAKTDKQGYAEMVDDPMCGLPSAQLDRKLTDIALHNNPDVALAETDRIIKKSINSKNYGAARVDLLARDGLTANQAMEESIRDITNTGAKGSSKKVDEYMKYFNGMGKDENNHSIKLQHDNEIQRASGYKSDLTGVAGSYSQRLIALTRDISPKAALEVTYKASQGTLQIKHDAEKGKVVKDVLTNDLNNLFSGKHVDSKDTSSLTKQQFIKEFKDVYENKLEVDVNVDDLKELAETLADGGNTIQPVSELMEKHASPIDQIAYGGGMNAIDSLAKANNGQGTKLASGKHSALIIPETIKDQNGKDKLIRRDTQDEETKQAIQDEINKAIGDPIHDRVMKENKVVRNNFAPQPVSAGSAKAEKKMSKEEADKLLDEIDLDF